MESKAHGIKEIKVSAAKCRTIISEKLDSDGTQFFGLRKKEHGGGCCESSRSRPTFPRSQQRGKTQRCVGGGGCR